MIDDLFAVPPDIASCIELTVGWVDDVPYQYGYTPVIVLLDASKFVLAACGVLLLVPKLLVSSLPLLSFLTTPASQSPSASYVVELLVLLPIGVGTVNVSVNDVLVYVWLGLLLFVNPNWSGISVAEPSVGELSVTTSDEFFLNLIDVNSPASFLVATPVKFIDSVVPTSSV